MLGKKSAKKKVKFQTGKKLGKCCHGFYVEAAHVLWSWIFVLLMQGIFMLLCMLLFCDQAFSLLLNVPLLYSFI